jgi:hypothetical protein
VPTVSVSLAPAPVYTDGVLTASATPADADGDTLSVRYDWYVDGALVQSGPDATLAGATSFDRDQVVYVTATVDDGVDSASATSGSVTVSNSAPTAPVVAITPGDATSGDDLTCTIVTESADADGDTIAYAFSWEVDGAAYAGAADSATESVVDGVDVEGGETWACIASAFDGTARSAVNSTELDIGCEEVLSEDWSSGVGPGWLSAYGSLAVNDGRLQIQRAAGQWGRVSRDLPDPLGALTLQVTLEVQDSASDIAICFVDTSSPTSLIGVLYAPTASLHHGVCVVLNNETLNGSIAGIHITENIGNVNLPVVAGTAIVASHAASVVAGVSREVVLVHDGFGVWRVLLDGVIVGSGLGPTGAYDALTIYGGNDSYDNHGGYVDDIRVFECDI